MININDSFFDGHYKEVWKAIIPSELTGKEVEFMISNFALGPESRVLDLMCGFGRHTLAFARRGISVTAVDNLAEYINEIRKVTNEETLPVKALQANVTMFDTDESYDLVICMGNSLNFFNREDVERLLLNVTKRLKDGGHLFINTWSLAEIVIKNFTPKSWSESSNLKLILSSNFLFFPTRIQFHLTILSPNGSLEYKEGVDYIYSINELEAIFANTGSKLIDVFSIPGKKKFSLGDPRAYLIAKKVS